MLSSDEMRDWRQNVDLSLLKQAEQTISEIVAEHPKAKRVWALMRNDPFLSSQWDMADYIAVTKMQYNAHGKVHAKVVTANALRMLDLLLKADVQPDIVMASKETESGDFIEGGDIDDAYLIILLAGLLHDIGNQVNRADHNLHSEILAIPILDKILPPIYPEEQKKGIIRGFILHCIYTHMEFTTSYTLEASLVKVADGTDMTKGRGRMPFEMGNVNINCVSAMSIEAVKIEKGIDKPISINISMNNSAGIYQVEEILHKKLVSGVAGKYIEITAQTIPETPSKDERIIYKITVEKDKFVHSK
jgi:metal-dependent HD superfamily phosphatase/phosphodiesterase